VLKLSAKWLLASNSGFKCRPPTCVSHDGIRGLNGSGRCGLGIGLGTYGAA
jgi:hypothetical protein